MLALNYPSFSLFIAIISEVFATTALKSCDGFNRPLPVIAVILGYAISFYFLSITLKTVPTGIAYALWSGLGIILISLLGWFVHKQTLDLSAIIGLALIIAGVIVINFFSKTTVA